MIRYNFGDGIHNISWGNFLKLTINDNIYYKSKFKEFSELIEFIDINLLEISNILLDNCEYVLENGKLHNLYGAAKTTYLTGYNPGWYYKFYICGKLVYEEVLVGGQTIKNIKDFNTLHLYVAKHNPKTTPKRDNIIKEINITELRINDKRNKKIKRIMSL